MSDFNSLIEDGDTRRCPSTYILALTDTLNVINGKWKLPIIASLFRGVNRFKDLLERTERITPRMLSKELKELELNGIIERKVYNQTPVLIEYRLTESGKQLTKVIDAMIDWGAIHRAAALQ
ncbi:MAG: helix-turn-helix transcriptional regulator [Mucilaginibacter polytrichastri]|nr:helix-turn-helix transcriptional regulator [Mucilaginibacter polytrichastri]